MPCSRTIWRSGFATAWLLVLALLGACEPNHQRQRPSARPQQERRLTLDAASEQPSDAGAPMRMPSEIEQTLRSVHEQKLVIVPPSSALQRLELGRGRLLQARGESAVFRDTKQGEVVATSNIGAVLAVAHGSDGSLFALGTTSGVRLDWQLSKPQAFPHAPFFPGSTLFADLEEPSHFYVYYSGEKQLYRYPFESEAGPFLPIEATTPLEGCSSVLTLLRDGAFACRTSLGYARKAPRGMRTELKAPAELEEPFRLLPAKRLDELFLVNQAGEVAHVRLATGLPVLGRFRLPALPYAAESNGAALAFVLVSAPQPSKERTWTLLVTDFDGQPRLQAELATQVATPGEDWLEAVLADKNLAISRFEPLVAVGGATQVTVWDYSSGERLFAR